MAKLIATYTSHYSVYADGTASLTTTNKTDGGLLMLSNSSTLEEVAHLLVATLGLRFAWAEDGGAGAIRLVRPASSSTP